VQRGGETAAGILRYVQSVVAKFVVTLPQRRVLRSEIAMMRHWHHEIHWRRSQNHFHFFHLSSPAPFQTFLLHVPPIHVLPTGAMFFIDARSNVCYEARNRGTLNYTL
jgi:hypothetical protein